MVTKMEIAFADIPLKLRSAYQIALLSTDRSTKNGAIICSQGFNVIAATNKHAPGYGDDPEHHERPMKYDVTEHAERAVILKAARKGISLKGLTLVANWVACPDCARAIVLAGISTVVCHKECQDRTPERWRRQVELGLEIMKHGGVEVISWSGKIGGVKNLNNGKWWEP